MAILRTLAVLSLWASVAAGAELRTLSGKTLQGDLVRITDKEVVLRGDNGEVATPLPEVLTIEFAASTPPPSGMTYTDVQLTDGSLFHCTRLAVKGKECELTLVTPDTAAKTGVRIQVPLAAVAYVLNDAQDPAERQEWQTKFLARKGNQDVLAIKQNDAVQRLEGTFGAGDETGEKIAFQLNARAYLIDLARIHGMVFVRRPNPDAPAPMCKVFDTYRNELAASKVEVGANALTITTVSGGRVEYPRAFVARFDYSNDKLAYLSDLEPVKVSEKSSLEWIDHYRRDKNLDGGPLRLAGKTYGKGLAVHAYTELVYDLDGKYKEFTAVLGVDEAVESESQALVRIDGDGQELFSATVGRKDKPRELALKVSGVKLLRIVVRSKGLLNLGDQVNLAAAQVSK